MRIAEESRIEKARLHETVERACGGDQDAFAELYASYYRRVLGLCCRFLGGQEDAEDAAAEVFLKMPRALISYDPSLPFLPWLLSVASHHCVDRLRRRKWEPPLSAATDATASVSLEPETSPLSWLLESEQKRRLREQIAQLPEHYRSPLVLRYYGEMKYNEIAKRLGMGRNSVATAIFRGKKELRRKMEPGLNPPASLVAAPAGKST